MENRSGVTSFILIAFNELEDHRYVYFTFFLLFFILTVLANVVLMAVVYKERSLHEPMYFFMCNLAVNGLYGSMSLYPPVLANLMSHTHEISLNICFLQVFCIYTYGSGEFSILAVMGYDRFVAICRPLHYHQLLTCRKVSTFIALCWIYPCVLFGLYFILTVQRKYCDRIIEKVYCIDSELVKLSCFEMPIHAEVGYAVTFFLAVPQLLMILFSYTQILRICLFASKESRIKAMRTCTPQLLSVINYAVGGCFELISDYLPSNSFGQVSYKHHILIQLYFLMIPPLFTPFIYGACIQAIRVNIFKLFITSKNKLTPLQVMMK